MNTSATQTFHASLQANLIDAARLRARTAADAAADIVSGITEDSCVIHDLEGLFSDAARVAYSAKMSASEEADAAMDSWAVIGILRDKVESTTSADEANDLLSQAKDVLAGAVLARANAEREYQRFTEALKDVRWRHEL